MPNKSPVQPITVTLAAYACTKYALIDMNALLKIDTLSPDIQARMIANLSRSPVGDNYHMESGDYVPVGTMEVTFKMTDANTMLQGQVDALRAEKKAIRAKAQREADVIDEKIAQLTAITFEG